MSSQAAAAATVTPTPSHPLLKPGGNLREGRGKQETVAEQPVDANDASRPLHPGKVVGKGRAENAN